MEQIHLIAFAEYLMEIRTIITLMTNRIQNNIDISDDHKIRIAEIFNHVKEIITNDTRALELIKDLDNDEEVGKLSEIIPY